MTLLSLLAFGFLLGMKHAVEADHLAAVATLAARRGSLFGALRQGAAWGLGHTITLLIFGGVVLTLGHAIPERLDLLLQLIVGLMLVALGLDLLRREVLQAPLQGAVQADLPSAAPAGSSPQHGRRVLAFATGGPASLDPHRGEPVSLIPGRALMVGMMHGMAGSAALIVLSLNAAPSAIVGIAYILVFGLGSILGMAMLSTMIAIPLRATSASLAGLRRTMTLAVALFGCGLGLSVIYRVVVVENLLLG